MFQADSASRDARVSILKSLDTVRDQAAISNDGAFEYTMKEG